MSVPSSAIRIPDAAVRDKYQAALGILDAAERAAPSRQEAATARPAFVSAVGGGPVPARREKADFAAALRGKGDDGILPPARHAVLHATRRAVAAGLVVGQYVSDPLGLLDLGERNRSNALTQPERERMQALVRLKAGVSAFAAAAHLAQALGAKPSGTASDPGEAPASTNEALGWLVATVAAAVRGAGTDDVAAAAARACHDVMDRAESDLRRLSGAFLADFERATYAIDEDGFRLSGFARPGSAPARSSVEIAAKRPEEVIGNHLAKAQAMRLARMLACHDFERGLNPFVKVGGFTFTAIGDGKPGTGKTTLIQMLVGLLKGYCDTFGYGLHYENFGVDQVSEYQGKSGQNCRGFVERVLDTRTIGFGTIDDIDQVAGRRDDKASSSGQQEITAVLMDAFAGAGTVIRGNASFAMFSNYPENVDDALRQRAAVRWTVDGPQTREDYVDILAMLLGPTDIPLGSHDLYAAQAIKRMVDESYLSHGKPKEKGLLDVWDRFVGGSGKPVTVEALGTYLHMIKEAEPRFTGRAIKNISDAVKTRSMDVDLPDGWFETPEAFAAKPFEEKCAMLSALRVPVTAEMVVQEINRYADSEFRYAGRSDQAAVDRMVRDRRLAERAARELAKEAPRA